MQMEPQHLSLYAQDTRDGTPYIVVGWWMAPAPFAGAVPYLAPMTGQGGHVRPAHADQCRYLRYSPTQPQPTDPTDPAATAVLPLVRR